MTLKLSDIPIEVFIHSILCYLNFYELINLRNGNKFLSKKTLSLFNTIMKPKRKIHVLYKNFIDYQDNIILLNSYVNILEMHLEDEWNYNPYANSFLINMVTESNDIFTKFINDCNNGKTNNFIEIPELTDILQIFVNQSLKNIKKENFKIIHKCIFVILKRPGDKSLFINSIWNVNLEKLAFGDLLHVEFYAMIIPLIYLIFGHIYPISEIGYPVKTWADYDLNGIKNLINLYNITRHINIIWSYYHHNTKLIQLNIVSYEEVFDRSYSGTINDCKRWYKYNMKYDKKIIDCYFH